MSEKEQVINDDYNEIAECYDIELIGFFILDDDGNVNWINIQGD